MISMVRKVYDTVKTYKLSAIRRAADHNYLNVFAKSKKDIKEMLPIKLRDATVLIIGCGYWYPEVLLFSPFVKKVVGIDVISGFYRDGFVRTLFGLFRKRRGIKSCFLALNECLRKRVGVKNCFYGRFDSYFGFKVLHKELQLITFDGVKIPFPDNTFDVVMSNAVLEHVMKIPSAVKEMARVTNEDGINYHRYHNYYSFSGNHKPYELNRKHPWGHLRGLIETSPEHLNKVKIYDLEKIFSTNFSDVEVFSIDKNHCKRGIDDQFDWEQEVLFQRYRGDLEKQFSTKMLLSRGFLIIARKKGKYSFE